MKIKNILGQSAFWMVNKEIAKSVGVEAALFLSYMIDKADTLQKKERDGLEWFYRTSEDIENETTLSYRVQKSCLKRLEEKGMMYTKLMGTPRKLYFTICESNILQNVNAIIDKSATIELTKAQGIYNEKPKNEKPKKEYIPTPEEFLEHALSKEPLLDKKHVKLKYEAWIEAGWKNGNGKEIKHWKSALNNTIPYLNKVKPEERKFVSKAL